MPVKSGKLHYFVARSSADLAYISRRLGISPWRQATTACSSTHVDLRSCCAYAIPGDNDVQAYNIGTSRPVLNCFACCAGQCVNGEYLQPNESLWSFDIKQRAWQQRQATGQLPDPRRTCGLAVINGKAYLLANEENPKGHMIVFELDLQTWQCQLLPCQGIAPPCLERPTPVVDEVNISAPSYLAEESCFHSCCLVQPLHIQPERWKPFLD